MPKNNNCCYNRDLQAPAQSFFLFGPRATGKTTFLRSQCQADLYIDLLKAKDFLKYEQAPSTLADEIAANPDWSLIIIDEIQKLPKLLDEVHSLIFEFGDKIRFILTGSSARKLKREQANMLAGRALVRHIFPLNSHEIGQDFHLKEALHYGLLPKIVIEKDLATKKDYLYAYVDTYLKEEIQQESIIRKLSHYTSFLYHMALRNGHVLNLSNISGEIGVPRATLTSYLQILEDTLLGALLQPLHLKAKVKEVSTPKFYFFDTGVVCALNNRLDTPFEQIDATTRGLLFETLILHELKSYAAYYAKRWQFYYWATPSGQEVDFIIADGQKHIGIEVKLSSSWKDEYSKGLLLLLEKGKIDMAIGVYSGEHKMKKESGKITIIPITKLSKFLRETF